MIKGHNVLIGPENTLQVLFGQNCQEGYDLYEYQTDFDIQQKYLGSGLIRDKLIIKPLYDNDKQLTWEWLSKHAYRSLYEENAGGNSLVSEALSIEYFTQFRGAISVSLEMEVPYWISYKKVDFTCLCKSSPNSKEIREGVSVTRAMGFPTPESFTIIDAHKLLNKKLKGLIIARNGISESDTFYSSYLHIWCQTDRIADLLEKSYSEIDITEYGLDIAGTLTLILTVSDWQPLYSNYFNSQYFCNIS